MSAHESDQQLVEAALAGRAGARRELASRLLDVIQREIAGVLRRLAASQARDPRQEVRDLVQEVLVSLFEHDCRELRRWDPARGRALDSFVRLIARRKAARILGQRKGNPWFDEPVDASLIGDNEADVQAGALGLQIEQRDALGSVLDALYARMDDRDHQLFDLLFVQEQDPAEVAELLGMSRGAVNAWAYRTRKLARACVLARESRLASSASPTVAKEPVSHE
jgi:RNA polymerase sigma factor (sigma-70 family)